jgi:V8-like Glu-specific endopeptidase
MQKLPSFPLLFRLGIIMVVLLGTLAIGTTQIIRSSKAASAVASSPLADASKTIAYWTPERRKAATPAQMPRRSSPSPLSTPYIPSSNRSNRMLSSSTPHAPSSNRNSSMIAHSAADPLATPVSSYSNELPISAIGRIFFYNTVKQKTMVCSGTVIASTNGSVVDTAGHCVYADGAWLTLWEFCPQYRNGNSHDGCWPAHQLFAASAWMNKGQWASDFGMAVIQPLNGQTIMSRVGGMPWEANFSQSALAGLFVTSYGYPGTPPYDDDAEQMYFIVRPLTFYTESDSTRVDYGTFLKLDNNDMGIGASGGPWFITYQGRQFLIGHSSFHINGVLAD